MTLTIVITPGQEAALACLARGERLAPEAYVSRRVAERCAGLHAEARLADRLAEWQRYDATPLRKPEASAVLFARWAAEDGSMTDADRDTEDRLWRQFAVDVNEARTLAGMRVL